MKKIILALLSVVLWLSHCPPLVRRDLDLFGTAASNIFMSTISSFGAAGAGFTDGMVIGWAGGGLWVAHGIGIRPRSIPIQTLILLR